MKTRKDHNMTSTVLICAVYLLLSLAGVTFLKSGHSTEALFTIPLVGVSVSVRTIIGILFYGLSFLVFTFYVSRLNIGIVIPMVSGLFCCAIVAIGYLYFDEHISAGQFVGIALVILGTIIVGVFK